MISSSSSIQKTAFSAPSTSESVIRSNGLGRSGSSNTSSCDINCSLPFLQGSPSFKPSSEPLVLRFKPHDLKELKKGAFIQRGVYKIIAEGGFFFEAGRLFEAIRYWRKNLFAIPSDSIGTAILEEMTKLINGWCSNGPPMRSYSLKALMIFSSLLLQKNIQ